MISLFQSINQSQPSILLKALCLKCLVVKRAIPWVSIAIEITILWSASE